MTVRNSFAGLPAFLFGDGGLHNQLVCDVRTYVRAVDGDGRTLLAPMLAWSPGPPAIGDTGDNSPGHMMGTTWLLQVCPDGSWVLYREERGRLEVMPFDDPPDPVTATARHVSLCFDQAARVALAWEDQGVIKVRRWDAEQNQYIENVSFSGVDPVVVFDASWRYLVPDSDVLLFYLSPDRERVLCRVQRDVYAAEYEIWKSGGTDPQTPALLTQGQPYSVTPAASGTFPDDGTKLTDGVFPTGTWPGDTNGYSGWQYTNPAAAFDFGEPVRVDSGRVWGLHQTSAGIVRPVSVALEYSDDGSTWTSAGSATPSAPGNPSNYDAVISSIETDPHQHWRLSCTRDGEWTFLGEIELYGGGSEPEPADAVILDRVTALPYRYQVLLSDANGEPLPYALISDLYPVAVATGARLEPVFLGGVYRQSAHQYAPTLGVELAPEFAAGALTLAITTYSPLVGTELIPEFVSGTLKNVVTQYHPSVGVELAPEFVTSALDDIGVPYAPSVGVELSPEFIGGVYEPG